MWLQCRLDNPVCKHTVDIYTYKDPMNVEPMNHPLQTRWESACTEGNLNEVKCYPQMCLYKYLHVGDSNTCSTEVSNLRNYVWCLLNHLHPM